MSTAIADLHEAPVEPRVDYLNASYGIKSWLLTFDHKRIGLLYLGTISFMFLVGGIAATLMRLHLIEPQGSLFEPETYNKLFSTHGIIMVFFFLVPSIPATLGNFLIPLMIGARDVAFPKLNLMSWYIFVIGCLFALTAVVSGGVDTGWTFYPPYSSLYAHTPVVVMALGVFIAGFSSILTGLNFIVTIHKMRAPGMTWFRLPLFIWSMYATSIIFVLGTPVIAITLFLLGLERLFHVGIFDPALGGDPLLFQHMFWFYSHPAVYIMILPSMGVVSELITAFSRKKIFGYGFVAFSSLAIAIISFVVWGHHMFVTGQSIYAGLVFSALSFLVAIPSAVKVFNWTATLYKGSVSYEAPMLYALGFIGLFTMGGLTGLFLASLATDVHLNGTYFVVAHFHYVMVGGALMGYLGGLHFWWPKITGRLYPDMWARIAAGIVFIGFNLTFFPQFVLGYLGMPRRYAVYPAEFQVLNVMSSLGASILAVGYVIPLVYLTWSMRYGPPAGPNPWGAKGLEWTTPSPPPTENFEVMPVVTEDAYEYPVLGDPYRGAARMSDVVTHVHSAHPQGFAHQYETIEQQRSAANLGMWTFLVTEILFFGGMFTAYIVYRSLHYPAFEIGSHLLEVKFGATNTAVLIFSSLTMAMAIHSAQTGKSKGTIITWLILTMILGATFLGLKFTFEWYHDYVEHIVPGAYFGFEQRPEWGAAGSQVQMFMCFYFFMTGLHALHMVIGLGILTVLVIMSARNRFSSEYYAPLEISGLYWHFVDIVWIFLFPLLYLIGGRYTR